MKSSTALALAKDGFKTVRGCLLRGEIHLALEVAAALHHLPESEEDFLYLGELTRLRLEELAKKYPGHPAIQALAGRLQTRTHRKSSSQ